LSRRLVFTVPLLAVSAAARGAAGAIEGDFSGFLAKVRRDELFHCIRRRYEPEFGPIGRATGTEAPECFVTISHRQAELTAGPGIRSARLAGFEPATRCLEGIPGGAVY